MDDQAEGGSDREEVIALLLLASPALGFDGAKTPLDVGGPTPPAAECAECHAEIYEQWTASRHSVASTNRIFVDGFAEEPVRRCMNCHAPLHAKGQADEGVNCVACHVRGDVVMSSGAASGEEHKLVRDERLTDGTLCAGCHQFNFHEIRMGQLIITDTPIQNTFEEWREYRSGGGEGSCVSCHMKQGHRMRGAHDHAFLRASVVVGAKSGQLSLRAVGVGHHLPTGDVFRHLLVEVRPDPKAPFETIAWIGRRYRAVEDPLSGRHSQKLVSDTSLRPFEVRRIAVPYDGYEYRVRYVLAADETANEVGAQSHLSIVVHQGTAAIGETSPPRQVRPRPPAHGAPLPRQHSSHDPTHTHPR